MYRRACPHHYKMSLVYVKHTFWFELAGQLAEGNGCSPFLDAAAWHSWSCLGSTHTWAANYTHVHTTKSTHLEFARPVSVHLHEKCANEHKSCELIPHRALTVLFLTATSILCYRYMYIYIYICVYTSAHRKSPYTSIVGKCEHSRYISHVHEKCRITMLCIPTCRHTCIPLQNTPEYMFGY